MKFSKRNAFFPIATIIVALFVSACATQQSAETKPVNNAPTSQQNPAAQPNLTAQQQNPPTTQNAPAQPDAPTKEPELEISLPTSSASAAAVGSTVTIPISVSSKSTKEIFSYSFAIMFDPKVLQPTAQPTGTTGTLSDGFMVASDTKTEGRLGIAAASANKTVKANGTLLNVQFKVIGKSSGKMDLRLEKPVFEDNSGNPINVNAAIKQ